MANVELPSAIQSISGKMTKKSNEFLKLDKVYEATLKLGYTSTTGDPEGEIQEYPARAASDRPVATGGRRSSSRCRAPEALRSTIFGHPHPA